MTEQDTERDGRSIKRRNVLRSTAALSAAGFVGVPAFSGAALADSEVVTCGELDIVCAIDTSGSLNEAEVTNLQAGVNAFIDDLPTDGSVTVGTLEFGGGGVRNKNDLQNPSGLDISISSTGGNTPMPGAMDIADQAVYGDSAARSDAIKLVVVFTDGGPNYTNTSYTVDGLTAPRDDSEDWSATGGNNTYDNADTASATVSKGEMDETALVASSMKDGSVGSGATSIATVYVGDEDTQAMTPDAISEYTNLPSFLENNVASSADFAIDVDIANIDALVDQLIGILEDLCDCPELTLELCAGQDIDVGTVTITEVGGSLVITYDLNEPWVLCESHVDIGDELDDLHTNAPGNPQVGLFDLSRTYDPCVSSDTYLVGCDDDAFADVDFETVESLFVAVHGVVRNTESDAEETAWVCEDQDDVSRFVDRGNWATYFTYDLCEEGDALDCVDES